jgi:hypothetical protein
MFSRPSIRDPGFGFVSRRDHVDGGNREDGGEQRRNDNPALLRNRAGVRVNQGHGSGAAGLSVADAGVATTCGATVFSLPAMSSPARQNAKRIAHPRRRKLLRSTLAITLY